MGIPAKRKKKLVSPYDRFPPKPRPQAVLRVHVQGFALGIKTFPVGRELEIPTGKPDPRSEKFFNSCADPKGLRQVFDPDLGFEGRYRPK